MAKSHILFIVFCICAFTQAILAFSHERPGYAALHSPNTSSDIARSIAYSGTYAGPGGDKLYGAGSPRAQVPLRAFHLPGEAIYLAAWMRFLPRAALPFAHVPVVLALVEAITLFAMELAGSAVALATGIVAALHPAILAHGTALDDMFLSAALEWSVLATVAHLIATSRRRRSRLGSVRWAAALMVLAGFAGITRLQSQIILGSLGILLVVLPSFRQLRPYGFAVVGGVVCAILAWGLRNDVVLGHFFIGSTHDGVTALESNYGDALEALRVHGSVEDLSQDRMKREFVAVQNMGELQTNAYYRAKALNYIADHPFAFAYTAAWKLFCSATGWTFGWRGSVARNLVALLAFCVTLGLGIPGIVILVRRIADIPASKELRRFFIFAMLIFVGSTAVMLAFGPAAYRYRISVDGFLYIGVGVIAVWALQVGADKWHAGRERASL